MVALLQDGKPEASWIYIPTQSICYFASLSGVEVAHQGTKYNFLEVKDKKTTFNNLNKLKFSASLRYLEPEIKVLIKDKLMHLKNQIFVGSAGIEATMFAKGQIDFIFHSITTPWDHAPVDMFCRAIGGRTGQLRNFERSFSGFKAEKRAPILFVRDVANWEMITDLITS